MSGGKGSSSILSRTQKRQLGLPAFPAVAGQAALGDDHGELAVARNHLGTHSDLLAIQPCPLAHVFALNLEIRILGGLGRVGDFRVSAQALQPSPHNSSESTHSGIVRGMM